MESRVYQLYAPYRIKEVKKNLVSKNDWTFVAPILAGICHADLRYFTGNRKPEALKKKLPMALLHEGIGRVLETTADFHINERVIFVPNIPGRLFDESAADETDKYTENGRFMGSGYDGIAQSVVQHPVECLVKIPQDIPDELAVLAEMASVAISALRPFSEMLCQKNQRIAIFGDGPVGFFAASYLHYRFGLGKDQLSVFGTSDEKLAKVDFAETFNVDQCDFSVHPKKYHLAVECTGGKFSSSAINQSINLMYSQGDIVLLGVSEGNVALNTRDILEKGLSLHGSSRSERCDFDSYLALLTNSSGYKNCLRKILPENQYMISKAEDLAAAFEQTENIPHWHKPLLRFDWRDPSCMA